MRHIRSLLVMSILLAGFCANANAQSAAPAKKPNIVVIWGDDIGMWNLGAYTHGMMGRTPNIDEKFGPRGVLHTVATTVDDPTVDPKFGRVGMQKIEDTGPLTRKRMETIDQEVTDQTLEYLDRVGKGDKPFFVWFNTTAIHIWSHPTQKYVQMAVDEGRAEEDVVRARMLEHDEQVGSILQKRKDLGVADNTIVVYSTDNGNEFMMWPMAAMPR